jgi:hypothetical protein
MLTSKFYHRSYPDGDLLKTEEVQFNEHVLTDRQALELVNDWNRQAAHSAIASGLSNVRFTYWIE